MGTYDNINLEIKCPSCGHKIDNFQSKDKDCVMSTLKFWQVDEFHTICNNCDIFIKYTLKEDVRSKFTLDDYKLITKELKKTKRLIKC